MTLAASGLFCVRLKHGNDLVPDVPRLWGDWQHPADLIAFPAAAHDYLNVDDHLRDPGIIRDAAGLKLNA